jgi:hypothetical protein
MERELLSEAGLRSLKLGVRVADGWPAARWERGFEVDRCRVTPGIGDILVQMAREGGGVVAKRVGSSQDRANHARNDDRNSFAPVSNARSFVRLSGGNRASQPA